MTNNHTVKALNGAGGWWDAVPMCQQRSSDSGFLTSRQQAEQRADAAWSCFSRRPQWLHCARYQSRMDASVGGGGDLRDGVLCKGQILHQHVQAFVIFIQELSHPPGDTKRRVNNSRAL